MASNWSNSRNSRSLGVVQAPPAPDEQEQGHRNSQAERRVQVPPHRSPGFLALVRELERARAENGRPGSLPAKARGPRRATEIGRCVRPKQDHGATPVSPLALGASVLPTALLPLPLACPNIDGTSRPISLFALSLLSSLMRERATTSTDFGSFFVSFVRS